MSVADLLQFAWQYGPVVGPALAVFIFYVWKDWKREMRLQDRVEALEKEQKDVLLPMMEQCVTVISQNTLIMQRLERVIERCSAVNRREQRNMLDRLIDDANDHR